MKLWNGLSYPSMHEEVMLNGPIQGGLFPDLRRKSATEMGEFDFSVHPIGGIVPVMEQQRYREYAKIMLSTLPYLPSNRPVHMFGCGHPMLFPMSIALGVTYLTPQTMLYSLEMAEFSLLGVLKNWKGSMVQL